MKSASTLFTFTFAMFFSSLLHAKAGWTDYAHVAELVTNDRHFYKFKLPVEKNPSGCRNDEWFYQDYSSIGSEKMYNTLLEGVKSKLRLRVYVTGACNIDGYSEISSIGIAP